MAATVYILCGITCFAAAVLLFRGYRRTGVRLLLWSSLCFAGLTLDNLILILDLMILPDVSLSALRKLPGLVGLMLLIFGLVWEVK